MFHVIATAATWVSMFVSTILLILWDRRRQSVARRSADGADTSIPMDRSPAPYIGLSLLFAPLPLIVYFGVTRKRWLLGIGIAAAQVLSVAILGAVLMLMGRSLDSNTAHSRATAACTSQPAPANELEDPCSGEIREFELGITFGYEDRAFAASLRRQACQTGRTWACESR